MILNVVCKFVLKFKINNPWMGEVKFIKEIKKTTFTVNQIFKYF